MRKTYSKSVGAASKLKIRAHRAAERVKSNAKFQVKDVRRNINFTSTRKFRRYSTLKTYTNLHLREISGAPKVKSNPSIFIEMFLVHLLYPISYLWVLYFYGSTGLDNLGFSFNKITSMLVTHVPFTIMISLVIWTAVDKGHLGNLLWRTCNFILYAYIKVARNCCQIFSRGSRNVNIVSTSQ